MTRIEKRLADLKARQESGAYTRCPRCGLPNMKPKLYTNALSRIADIMVCDTCGVDEAKLAFMGSPGTLYQWAALQPEKAPGDFRAVTAEEAWKRICDEQANTITRLYHLFVDGKETADEIRYEAFESCPGLTQIWTEPYHMRYACKNGTLLIQFKDTETGLEMTASLVDEK